MRSISASVTVSWKGLRQRADEGTLGLGLRAVQEAPIEVTYKDAVVGSYFADILVESSVICEVKATRSLLPEHEAQLLHYLKATGIHVGLLLNFGAASVQVKRMVF